MITFSEDQATALVTDPGTLKRGQELASPAKWSNLGRTEAAAWGECTGSGSRPYLTAIDLTEPAFKCSCPSRVFPCKHGAGLLLLLARQPALLTPGQPPAWLAEWLAKRQSKNEEQLEKAAVNSSKQPALPTTDPGGASQPAATAPTNAAQQKRETQRLARMQTGAADLETWLLDLLRAGLADLASKPASLWESQAARLVDNQLPGLAAVLRELGDYPTAGPAWADRLLGRLGELYVLVRAFLNREHLAPTAWQDVAQQVGLTLKKEALLTDPGALALADTWLVLGQHTWPEERLAGRRSWLYGQHSGRVALLLEFAFGSQPFATALVPQARYGGELVFYPGLLRLRAVPSTGLSRQADAPDGRPAPRPLAGLLDAYAASLARQPWLRELPATVWAVVGRNAAGTWHLHDPATGAALPLRLPGEQAGWPLLALSGGQPRAWFGEWDGQAFRVLSHWRAAPADVLPPAASPIPGAEAPFLPAPPPANPWPALLRVALLGTRQTTEALPQLNLGDFPQADNREQQVLLSAGTLALLRKAGFLLLASPLPAPAPPEIRPLLGQAGQALLRQLLSRPHYRPLLGEYLRALGEHRRLVPPALLVKVLGWVKEQPEATLFVEEALGERGRWLAAQNPDWQHIVDTAAGHQPTEADWRTGPAPRRRLYLEQQLLADPAHAAQLLTEDLPQEPAAAQVVLLGALAAWPPAKPLPAGFAPVLESLLASRAKEVRQTAARWLARTTDSALLPRLWTRAEPLLRFKRKLLGHNSLEITLPSWSAEWQRDGIAQKSADYPGGEKAAQLGQLLALVPPGHWATTWGVSATQAVALAAASEWASVLLPAWLRAAQLHHDAHFALALLRHEASQPSLPPKSPLLAGAAGILSAAQREDWLRAALPNALPAGNGWAYWLALAPQPWPEALWRRSLPLLRAALHQPASWAPEQTDLDQAVRGLLLALGSSDEPSLLANLTADLEERADVQPRFAEEVAQLLELLELRPRLAASLLEEATESVGEGKKPIVIASTARQ